MTYSSRMCLISSGSGREGFGLGVSRTSSSARISLQRNAFVADVYAGSRDEFLHTFFGLSAEAAAEVCFCHDRFPFPRLTIRIGWFSSDLLDGTLRTRSISPYSTADCGLIKRSRSTSSAIRSTDCPECLATIPFSFSPMCSISCAAISMSDAVPCDPPEG